MATSFAGGLLADVTIQNDGTIDVFASFDDIPLIAGSYPVGTPAVFDLGSFLFVSVTVTSVRTADEEVDMHIEVVSADMGLNEVADRAVPFGNYLAAYHPDRVVTLPEQGGTYGARAALILDRRAAKWGYDINFLGCEQRNHGKITVAMPFRDFHSPCYGDLFFETLNWGKYPEIHVKTTNTDWDFDIQGQAPLGFYYVRYNELP